MNDLITSTQRWFADPLVAKFITAIIAIFIITIAVRIFRRSVSRYIQDPDTSYRLRKVVTFVGYGG